MSVVAEVVPMIAAQRFGVQLPRARWKSLQNTNDLARAAVSCNTVFGGLPLFVAYSAAKILPSLLKNDRNVVVLA
jgi:hypothetical protein